jgi:hypothetical protein
VIEYINDLMLLRFAEHDAPAHPHAPYKAPQRIAVVRDARVDLRIVWRPQPRQEAFLRRPEYEVLYGGAAGGGKTDALLMWLLEDVRIPWYTGLFLRKTFPELEQAMTRSMELYPRIVPGARWNDNKKVWRFPSGARIYMGSCQHERDILRYQGRAFDRIAMDEQTHFSFYEYSYMFSRNRPSGKGTFVAMRSASNPGGIGHAWVKGRFIDNRVPGQSYKYELSITDPNGKSVSYTRHRAFIPATVFDNAILLENDPNYVAAMAMLPEAERMALLYGSWDSFSGQAFPEWRDNPNGRVVRQWSHVVDDFTIPVNWKIFRSFDFGYAKPFSCNWYAMDNDSRLYKIRELYGCTTTPNTGIRWHPGVIAAKIREMEQTYYPGARIMGVADPSIWDASRGESIAVMMEREGIHWIPGDNKRIPGKQQMHYRLAFDGEGYPMYYVFASCKHTIRTMPSLVYDLLDVEDIDTDGEDHIYDADRYLMMEHPLVAREHHQPPIQLFDPLNLHTKASAVTFFDM